MTKTRPTHILTILGALLLISACSKLCNSGYEGSSCNTLTITKFEGNWKAIDTPGNLQYTDTITKGVAINDITFSTAFAGHSFVHTVSASVLDSVITIPNQQPDQGGYFVRGTGILTPDNKQINFNYELITGPDSSQTILSYTGIWLKQ